MLDRRAQLLLKTLIERYIAEGQPIGSRTLSKYSGLDLSPATIRNVMSDLEELGFIASPHTSAGRVPTPAGYRFFVDTLLVVKQLESGELRVGRCPLATSDRALDGERARVAECLPRRGEPGEIGRIGL